MGLVLTVVGLALLGRMNIKGPGILIGLGLIGMPWALSLLSEHAIRAFEKGTRFARFNAAVGGAVLVLVAVGVAWAVTDTVFAAVALGALALLIVALSSSTLADITVVLAIVALMGITAQDAKPPEATSTDEKVLVVLGDSYMSGEGASIFIEGTDDGATNECRRATTSWASMSGQLPPFDGVLDFSCSGADSDNIRHGKGRQGADNFAPVPYAMPGEGDTQLDAYVVTEKRLHPNDELDPALVVLSIGGNDAGFSTIGLTCLAPGSCNDKVPEALWNKESLSKVENRLRQVYDQVDAQFKHSPVVVIPYIDPIYGERKCGQAVLEGGDITFVKGFLRNLNGRIKTVADQYGFYYLADMETALADRHLQLCDPDNRDRPGLNFIGLRSVNGLGDQRFNPSKWHHNSLHPNARGHAAMFSTFQHWLADRDLDTLAVRRGTADKDRTTAKDETQEPVEGKCWTYSDGPNDCRSQSTDWAMQQAGTFVLKSAVLIAFAVGGAWLFASAIFGSRRSRRRARLVS